MREIKFREFVNGKFHYWGFTEEGLFKGPVTPSLIRGFHSQFTGHRDKNGKEMYEGDILQYMAIPEGYPLSEPKLHKVVIQFETALRHSFLFSFHEYEVSGNIYENPNLLK